MSEAYWRAITLWQPWASLWCLGVKKHETRHWPTDHTGWLIVHAAARKIDKYYQREFELICVGSFGENFRETLPRGAFVGAVWMTGCHPTHDRIYDLDDLACGDFSPGRFAWSATQNTLYTKPVPYKGQQGFFRVPADLLPLGEAAA